MIIEIQETKEVNVTALKVEAGVRYWEDATVNGFEDLEGDLIPCRQGDCWCPIIDLEAGKILNWKAGTTADVHYKVCDSGTYTLIDEHGNEALKKEECYVPKMLYPGGNGYGDYIIMKINEDGIIENFKANLEDFQDDEL